MWFLTWIRKVIQRWIWEPPKAAQIEPKKLYEHLYPLDTPKESIEESIDHLMHKRVEENTPEGHVILSYDESSNTFLYWAQKPIAYRYLEVVARKYVILYDCKGNYVNMLTELLKAMNPPEKKDVGDSPFAVFKTYNTVAHKVTNKKIANETGNHYKHMGKELITPVVQTFKPISFVDYKKIQNKGNE
jgi:hypothetical protein